MTLLSATEVAVSTDEHGETGKGQKNQNGKSKAAAVE
jgi:hypothetical protein